tara:strand:+ start:743 stop:1102 length:360 start_codon:yes stop_codon:yes gene_type:complete
MPVINGGSKFVTHATALTTTSDTDCYVVPSNFSSHVENLMITNDNAGNIAYTLKYYEADTTTTHTLFSAHNVSGKSAEYIFTVDKPLFLHAGDKIIIAAGTANELTAVVAAEEFFEPHR